MFMDGGAAKNADIAARKHFKKNLHFKIKKTEIR